MIISKTPFRISLIGGGTDFPEYYKKAPGLVIGGTIDKYCYVSARFLPNVLLTPHIGYVTAENYSKFYLE